MKRILATIFAAIQVPILFWIADAEFVRGMNMTFYYGYTVVLAVFMYYAPWWEDEE